MDSSAPSRDPESEHLATFWTLRGPSERNLTCSAFRVVTGLELRTECERGDIVATELFRGDGADERLAERGGRLATDAAREGLWRDSRVSCSASRTEPFGDAA
jgi:hypothetical protein